MPARMGRCTVWRDTQRFLVIPTNPAPRPRAKRGAQVPAVREALQRGIEGAWRSRATPIPLNAVGRAGRLTPKLSCREFK